MKKMVRRADKQQVRLWDLQWVSQAYFMRKSGFRNPQMQKSALKGNK